MPNYVFNPFTGNLDVVVDDAAEVVFTQADPSDWTTNPQSAKEALDELAARPTSGETNTASNIGGGEEVFAQKVGVDLEFKTLLAGTNVTLTSDADSITIDASSAGEANTASNLGAGEGVFAQKTGVDLEFKSLVAGTNVALTSDATSITIDASSAGEANTASNIGGGEEVFAQKVGVDLEFKTLIAGTNVTLTSDADSITIDASGAGEANTASNIGTGDGVFAQKNGVDLEFKSLVGGTNIILTPDADSITIDASGEANSAANIGTGEGIYAQKNGATLEFKSLVAGTNVVLTSSADSITIDASGAGEANTASNLGLGEGVFAQKTGVDLEFKSFVAGTNVTLTSDANSITIDATDTGESNTASNIGTGEGIFAQKTGIDLEFKTLVAGTNVTLTSGTDIITIDASSAGEANTASNLGLTGEGVFAQKTGVDLEFKKLKAGTNISLTSDSESITITSSGGGGGSYADIAISAFDIDWNAGTTFYKAVSANATFTFSNVVAGKSITVAITNSTGSSYSLLFPTTKQEPFGLENTIFSNSTNIYTFTSINGVIYCSSFANVA